MAYVDFDGKAVLEALEEVSDDAPIDKNFLKTHTGRVIEGVNRLCDWLGS
jgi:hypothetical protein